MSRMLRALGAAALLLAMADCLPVYATEGGTQEYPLGVNTVLPALLPPPGHAAFLDYFQYYSAPIVTDGNGTKIPANFHLNLEVEAGRVLYSWPIDLGDFGVTSGAVLQVENGSLHVDGQSDARLAFGDTLLQPIILGYNSPDHTLFAWIDADLWVPTGQFSTKDLFNVGLNRLEVAPSAAVTWFPNQRIQASLFSTFEIPFKDPATDYLSGQSIDIDYGLDYQPVTEWKRFHVGVGGYAFQQVSPGQGQWRAVQRRQLWPGHRDRAPNPLRLEDGRYRAEVAARVCRGEPHPGRHDLAADCRTVVLTPVRPRLHRSSSAVCLVPAACRLSNWFASRGRRDGALGFGGDQRCTNTSAPSGCIVTSQAAPTRVDVSSSAITAGPATTAPGARLARS